MRKERKLVRFSPFVHFFSVFLFGYINAWMHSLVDSLIQLWKQEKLDEENFFLPNERQGDNQGAFTFILCFGGSEDFDVFLDEGRRVGGESQEREKGQE